MSENWNVSVLPDGRTPAEIIRDRVEMLGAVFNRKVSEELIVVFQEALSGYSRDVLKKGFLAAERSLEKFPTPKMMRLMCNEEVPSQAWRYHYEPALGKDPETGQPIRVLIDPDPSCDSCRNPRSEHPTKTCPIFKDWSDARQMYRAEDCPEGRAFLAGLKALAKR